jgi:hypothetical protein
MLRMAGPHKDEPQRVALDIPMVRSLTHFEGSDYPEGHFSGLIIQGGIKKVRGSCGCVHCSTGCCTGSCSNLVLPLPAHLLLLAVPPTSYCWPCLMPHASCRMHHASCNEHHAAAACLMPHPVVACAQTYTSQGGTVICRKTILSDNYHAHYQPEVRGWGLGRASSLFWDRLPVCLPTNTTSRPGPPVPRAPRPSCPPHSSPAP